jgi:hypothetical protein
MIAVRTFPDESSMSHILRPMRWEWLEAGSQRLDLTSSNSGEVRSSPAQRTCDDLFGTSGSDHEETYSPQQADLLKKFMVVKPLWSGALPDQ